MAKQTFTTGQVLTAAQMTSLQQTAMLGGAASAKTASYTLVAADAGTAISMSNAGATTITVNTSLFAAGDTVQITNLGAGVCTITAGTATVDTSASLALAQYESGTLDFTSTSAAIFIKGAGAAAGGGGADFSLLNSGGTALTGAQDVTISGISGKNTIMVVVNAASSANASASIVLRLNGSTTDTDYSQVFIENIGASAYDTGNFDANGYIPGAPTSLTFAQMSGSATSQVYGSALIQGANTTNPKIIQMFGGARPATNNGQRQQIKTAIFEPAATISSITIRSTSGNLDAGTVFVYGSAV